MKDTEKKEREILRKGKKEKKDETIKKDIPEGELKDIRIDDEPPVRLDLIGFGSFDIPL